MTSFSVLFDMDGVLADTAPFVYDSFNFTLNAMYESDYLGGKRIQITKKYFARFFGRPLADMVKDLSRTNGVDINLDAFKGTANIYQGELMNDPTTGITTDTNIDTLLKELNKNDIPMAIATSSSHDRACMILSLLGYFWGQYESEYFQNLTTGNDVNKGKPNPQIFMKANRNLGSDYAVVIEDSPDGIKAAKRAGMIAVAVVTEYHDESEFKNADLIITDKSMLTYDTLSELVTQYKQNDTATKLFFRQCKARIWSRL